MLLAMRQDHAILQLVSQWVYVQCKRKENNSLQIWIYLSQLYSYAHVASQNEQPLQASYKARICAQVNHLVHAKPSFAEYNCCKTSPHTFGSDAENPEAHHQEVAMTKNKNLFSPIKSLKWVKGKINKLVTKIRALYCSIIWIGSSYLISSSKFNP